MGAMSSLVRVWWPVVATALAAILGGLLALADAGTASAIVWGLAIVAVGASLVVEIVGQLRRREPGVDVVALLAMVGALALGELLAGVIIALMLTTGRALEGYADARARRELTALLEGAPSRARRLEGGTVVEVPVDEVRPGDLLVVPSGEAIPVDAVLRSPQAVLDESMLTGESRPVERTTGERLASGAVNAGGPIELRASATAADSTYSGLVRLVEKAQSERAPFVRLADRAAAVFVPVTLVVAAGAWIASGDPVRALAVLVVATPCPLILATPIAITSGISRLARRGVIVKGGGALEHLARTRTILLDKTGTVTTGRPRVLDIEPIEGDDTEEIIRLAASLEQLSSHVFAAALVRHATERGIELSFPSEVEESAGSGITGVVDGRRVRLGGASYAHGGPLPAAARAAARRAAVEGLSAVYVSADGVLLGALLLEDPLRAEAVRTVRGLRRAGVRNVVLLTGDRADVGELVGDAVDVDRVLAERRPEDKVDAVVQARADGVTVMVGDGVNDAPALATADVGIAMGGRGATASSEAADMVVTVDRFDRVLESLLVARRTRRIAWQAIYVGMGAAALAMVFAAAGALPPVMGALVQEAIDVVAILIALRALSGGRGAAQRPAGDLVELSGELRAEHAVLQAGLERLRTLADQIDELPPTAARQELRELAAFLAGEVMTHERAEDRELYPLMAGTSAEDALDPLRHTHREIFRLIRLFDSAVAELPAAGPSAEDLPELRRLMYGLHAVLRLHIAQEEELFGLLDLPEPAPTSV